MDTTSVIGTLILFFTGLFTYQGFRDTQYFEDYLFEVDKILIDKQYHRLFSAGFLHGSWLHFGFNMIALLSFCWSLEHLLGAGKLALIYFVSLLGSSLLSLYLHRQHADYRAVGASGAVSGVIFASIVLYPDHNISFVFIPIEVKSWVLALLFVAISILGIKKQGDNIGHDAHLGGALTGVFLTLLLKPQLMLENWWIVLAILIPSLFFLIVIIRNPAVLMVEDYWGETLRKSNFTPQKKPLINKEAELNRLLDKISQQGMETLSSEEKERLEQLTKEI